MIMKWSDLAVGDKVRFRDSWARRYGELATRLRDATLTIQSIRPEGPYIRLDFGDENGRFICSRRIDYHGRYRNYTRYGVCLEIVELAPDDETDREYCEGAID